MKITQVQVYMIPSDQLLPNLKTVGYAQVNLDDVIQLTGLRIIKGRNGLHVQYPRNPASKNGLCFVFPYNEELRKEIERVVLLESEKEFV